MMGLGLRIYLTLRCDVCKKLLDQESADATAIDVALFGAVPYAVCPACGQEKQPPFGAAYKKRVDKYVKEKNTP